ncbi:MAG: flagellar hook-length control protein FliK [Spirochaetaceae bacterium]|nr:MAG: flagellar hook-length control protein FliK [Spirochaetaceae bacterium]
MLQNPGGSLPVLADFVVQARPAQTLSALDPATGGPNLFRDQLDAVIARERSSTVRSPLEEAHRYEATQQQYSAERADQQQAQNGALSEADRHDTARSEYTQTKSDTEESDSDAKAAAEDGEAQRTRKESRQKSEGEKVQDEQGSKAERKKTAAERDEDNDTPAAESRTANSDRKVKLSRLTDAGKVAKEGKTAKPDGEELAAEKKESASGSVAHSVRLGDAEAADVDTSKADDRGAALERAAVSRNEEAALQPKRQSGAGGPEADSHESEIRQALSAARRSVGQKSGADESADQNGSHEQDDQSDSRSVERNQRRAAVTVEVRDLRPDSDKNGADSSEARSARVETDGSSLTRRLQADAERLQSDGGRGHTTLSRALREQANPEIVRQARLVVRGESSGDIRLVLKPEHLGRVRINLHLEDNRIAGRIIVENSSVKEAFQENLQALQRSLQQSGIETSGLEVSVGEGGGDNAGRGNQSGLRRAAAAEFDELVPGLGEWWDEIGLVNVYA